MQEKTMFTSPSKLKNMRINTNLNSGTLDLIKLENNGFISQQNSQSSTPNRSQNIQQKRQNGNRPKSDVTDFFTNCGRDRELSNISQIHSPRNPINVQFQSSSQMQFSEKLQTEYEEDEKVDATPIQDDLSYTSQDYTERNSELKTQLQEYNYQLKNKEKENGEILKVVTKLNEDIMQLTEKNQQEKQRSLEQEKRYLELIAKLDNNKQENRKLKDKIDKQEKFIQDQYEHIKLLQMKVKQQTTCQQETDYFDQIPMQMLYEDQSSEESFDDEQLLNLFSQYLDKALTDESRNTKTSVEQTQLQQSRVTIKNSITNFIPSVLDLIKSKNDQVRLTDISLSEQQSSKGFFIALVPKNYIADEISKKEQEIRLNFQTQLKNSLDLFQKQLNQILTKNDISVKMASHRLKQGNFPNTIKEWKFTEISEFKKPEDDEEYFETLKQYLQTIETTVAQELDYILRLMNQYHKNLFKMKDQNNTLVKKLISPTNK